MPSPRVSVVVPAFNSARYLPEAIESVLAQSFEDWEILVVDDGSADETLDVAQRYAGRDPRIRVLRHPDGDNHGIPKTRNRALDEARGDLVAFLDADDTWAQGKLQRQVAIMDEHPRIGFTYGRAQSIDEASRPIPERPGVGRTGIEGRGTPGLDEHPYEAFVALENIAPTSTVMVRTDLIRTLGGFDERFPHGQDRLMWIRLARATPAYFAPDPLSSLRKRPGSHSSRRTRWEGGETQLAYALALAEEHGSTDRGVVKAARASLVLRLTSHGTPWRTRLAHSRRTVAALLAAPGFSRLDVARVVTAASLKLVGRVAAWSWRRVRELSSKGPVEGPGQRADRPDPR